jgi:hypothetical protein
MTVARIYLVCNGPVTSVGPISECANTFEANAYAVDLARAQSRRDGWRQSRMDNGVICDLCPEHAAAGS